MKILVIEDQRRLADSIVKGLKQEKYQAKAVYDGVSALNIIDEEYWNVILLDWMLPGKNGKEILQELRSRDISIPVIFLTAKGEVSDKVEALEIGADDYLVKPFDFSELLARINAILRRPDTYVGTILEIDDLQLDTSRKEVRRGDTILDLSLTEYRLLEYLMRSPNQVKSESQILDNVWDYADEGLSNKVSVYIRYLRNKVDRDFPDKPSLIQTVRGFGYKISI